MLHVDSLYNTLQKLSTTAVNVITAIWHFESAMNDIRNNLLELEKNLACSIKRARKEINISAEAKEACDIIVTQIKCRFEEAQHTLCFVLIEPQLFAVNKNSFPKELVTSAVKFCPVLCKDKLESELTGMKHLIM